MSLSVLYFYNYNFITISLTNIGINSINSNNASPLELQVLLSIPKSDSTKINQHISYIFPKEINFSNNDIIPKIYSTILKEEKDINVYLYILLFYEKIPEMNFENKTNSEGIYCPISVIIKSHYANIDFFKQLLINFYHIIKFDTSLLYNYKEKRNIKNNNNLNKNAHEKIKAFQNLEFLNYINFCVEIPRPPNKSILTMETRFDKIKYKFQSYKEIPTSDYCIDILFDTLEISVIIKLFIALLFEKQIIILADQNMLLFCICESLLRLIFPFRWLYTYIPNLPKEKNDILEIKRPYLIGMISDKGAALDLNNKFVSNIICDVNTSTIYGNTSNLKLPFNEEMKIKTKLLLLKDKYKNNYDEFDLDDNINYGNETIKKDSIDKYEDVDFDLSFAENVHNIFFKIFKNNLMNIKKYYIIKNVFESQKFLDSFDDEEYKLFFEKIIVTSAFDYFISSIKFLDNSLSTQFNLIYNFADTRLKGKSKKINYYNYSLSIPKKLKSPENTDDINLLIKLNNNNKNVSEIFDNYNEISTLLDENIDSYMSNSGNSISDYLKRRKNHKNIYSYITFYQNNGFIEFAKEYKEYINYVDILTEEALIFYKKAISFEAINKKTNIINLPNVESYQFYHIIALYLFNYLSYEYMKNNNNINLEQKLLKTKTQKNNSTQQILKIAIFKDIEISKEIIFNLFLKSYQKNQDEFPRNLFITILKSFSLEELKNIKSTSLKLIDKTIQFQILKLQKISYESMVIRDSDDEEEIENKNEEQNNNLELNKLNSKSEDIFNTLRNKKKRKTSVQYDYIPFNKLLFGNKVDNKNDKKVTFKNSLELSDEDIKENLQKTKLNVLGDNIKYDEENDNKLSKSKTKYMDKSDFLAAKDIYKLVKITNEKLKSCNNIKTINNTFKRQASNKNLNLDPMEISEKICIKLYIYLCSKKIENFTEKNSDINFLRELGHSNTFDEIKNLILSLKYISLENLSASKNNYYCFWLNMYNFLTIFSVIYKSEVASNLYEWLRFLKNSYFTIGNVDISLLEIEAFILRDENIIKNIYGININNDQLKLPKIDKFDSVINFGISLSTISSPDVRIYYPSNFIQSLKYSASLFFSKNLKIDLQRGTIEIPEYINMIEPNFDFNMEKYKDYFEQDFLKVVKENPSFKIIIKKFNWNLNFVDFKNY